MTSIDSHNTFYDFTSRLITIDGVAKTIYVAGRGRAVVVLHEMPGIGGHVLRFARWVRDAGFTVYLPSLFGRDGTIPTADEGAAIYRRACVSAEFRALGAGSSSPVTHWLRGLARMAHAECGGAGVGAIGMCFTGNFALTMMLEPAVLAPVLCEPSLPLDQPAALESSAQELHDICRRLEREDLTVLAYRFSGDRYCTAARFAAYERALGERFIGRVLPDDAAGFSDAPPFHAAHVNFAHSVVTVHLVDGAGEPTIAARDEILAFLDRQLHPAP